MATRKKKGNSAGGGLAAPVADYRHPEATRKNNPPAKIAAEGHVPLLPKAEYSYSPRLAPVLRFDPTGSADQLPELLAEATRRPLNEAEAWALAEALRKYEPWLEWAGKREAKSFLVDPVALHIHERVSAQAILKIAARQDVERSLFGEEKESYHEAVQFYRHDIDWTNRLILGDSLAVMSSLAKREDLAGKVQMIYIDPPYGIKFASNFQPEIGRRDVKDKETDLTREPEMVKAYRDTWTLGIHSYLSYLRDRIVAAKELLADTGSIFVQIGDENVHRVRQVIDEVFGSSNFVAQINFRSMMPLGSDEIEAVYDYVVWYCRAAERLKYRNIWVPKAVGEGSEFVFAESDSGEDRRLGADEVANIADTLARARVFKRSNLSSSGYTESCTFPVSFQGEVFAPVQGKSWRTTPKGVERLIGANRIFKLGQKLYFKLHHADFGFVSLQNSWQDTIAFEEKSYVVQTTRTVIERCMLMTTDPGDLVLDPTCGSGTTPYVAEQWGRRWITIDTSRVAIALARSRLMGARYPYYLLADSPEGQRKEAEVTRTAPKSTPTHGDIRHGFVYERVPHITLKSIANNAEIDVIWEKWEPQLRALREELSVLRVENLNTKDTKDARRTLEEWEVPREAPAGWSEEAKKLLAQFWEARIARQKEIDASIAAKAEFEFLYDKPYVDTSRIRVAGPFTVESLSPHRTLAVDWNDELIDILEASEGQREAPDRDDVATDFAQMILENLRAAGVQQAHKEDRIVFNSLTGWPGHYICAEGTYLSDLSALRGEKTPQRHEGTLREMRAGIFIGPEFGTVSRPDLVAAAREAGDAGFDVLIACAFNYDAHSSEFDRLGRVPVLKARMNPDLHMGCDLKATAAGNLFVVFGEPDIKIVSGQWLVTSGGRKVMNYERLAKLSGFGSLEEINRLGRSDLPHFKRLAVGREVRSDPTDTPGGGVHSGQ